MPSSTSTVLASSLWGSASAAFGSEVAGFAGSSGPRPQARNVRHVTRMPNVLYSHRNIAALASRSILANAASNRASRY